MASRSTGASRRETANPASAADDIDAGWDETPESISIPRRGTELVSGALSSLPPVSSVPRPRSLIRELTHDRSVSTSEVADGPTLEIREATFETEEAVRWIGEALGSSPSIEVVESDIDALGDFASEIAREDGFDDVR